MSKRVAYETWPIDDINPVPWNPRIALTPADPEWKQIEQSLDHFGLVVPLVVNRRTHNLLSGHQRLAVCKHRGYTELPVTIVDIDPDDEIQLNMAMNAIHGRWDDELLAGILDHLADAGVAHLTGFSAQELAYHTGQLAAELAADAPPPTTGNSLAPPADQDLATSTASDETIVDDDEFATVTCPNCNTKRPA